MDGDTEKTCKNCRKRIVKKNFSMGEKWMHQPAGASFDDHMYEFCKITVAEPEIDDVITRVDKYVIEINGVQVRATEEQEHRIRLMSHQQLNDLVAIFDKR